MTRRPTRSAAMPLYPSEDEIARAVLGAGRVKDWPSIAAHDERRGLPPVDPVHGGRPWPLVERFYHRLMGIGAGGFDSVPSGVTGQSRVRIIDTAPDGQEDYHAEKDAALRNRRSERRSLRARV